MRFSGATPTNSDFLKDIARIDDEGNLLDFVPETKPRDIEFSPSYMEPHFKVIDLESGKELQKLNDGYSIFINPGSGKFLFIGHENEAKKLHDMLNK